MNNHNYTNPEINEALMAAWAFAEPTNPALQITHLAEGAVRGVIAQPPVEFVDPVDVEKSIADVLKVGEMLAKHRDDYDVAA